MLVGTDVARFSRGGSFPTGTVQLYDLSVGKDVSEVGSLNTLADDYYTFLEWVRTIIHGNKILSLKVPLRKYY